MTKEPVEPTRKPEPNEERVVVPDLRAALEQLLKKSKQWKSRFDEAHADGMAALKNGDTAALGNAIDREKAIIEEQRAAIIEATKPPSKPA